MIDVNFIAVAVAAIAAFAVGALWYSVLFGRQWRVLMGMTPEVMAEPGRMGMGQAMAGGFVATLVMTFVLANLLAMTGTTTAGAALTLAFWIWLGFVATIMSNSLWYENRPLKLYVINVSHYFVALLVAALVLTLWSW